MVDENISTGLRNAIERGENLEDAVQIMINTGYNPDKVKEASQFISSGALTMQEQKPDEILLMPKKKGFFSNIFSKSNKNTNQKTIVKSNQNINPNINNNIKQNTIPNKDNITIQIEKKLKETILKKNGKMQ